MSRLIAAIALACAFAVSACMMNPALARPKHARADSQALAFCAGDQTYRVTCGHAEKHAGGHARVTRGDPRPRAWCGWWLRHELGVSDRAGNLARWWARYGSNARGPAVGAIVVWRHHVGIITVRTETGWIVRSGNDGHAVRERERSLRGAIAFRLPSQVASR